MKSENCTTVGELAAQFPQAARVLERAGIDYCCGGRKPLTQACAEAGLDADALLAELRAGAQPEIEENWQQRSSTDLIAHIVGKYHAYVREETPRLKALIAKPMSLENCS